ncbi:MAG: DMT family transporter [Xenococcus sp. MO_188.B8]|nr:DMT family transporter [Xenococcus sp. MO_188.B8]
MNNQKFFGYTQEAVATGLMASLGFFVRNVSANEEVITLARFGIGFLSLAIYLLLTGKIKSLKPSDFSISLVLSGVAIALCILFYIKALRETSLANAVFLLYLGPFIATAFAAIRHRERFTTNNFSLLCVAFLGCFFILEFKVSFHLKDHLGYFFGLLAAILYAVFIVLNKEIPERIPSYTRAFYQLLFATLSLIPLIVSSENALPQTGDWVWLLAIGFFQGFIALTLMISAVKRLQVHEYGTISYLEPLIATLLGLLIYSEALSLWQAVGCLIVLIAGIAQVFNSKPLGSHSGQKVIDGVIGVRGNRSRGGSQGEIFYNQEESKKAKSLK